MTSLLFACESYRKGSASNTVVESPATIPVQVTVCKDPRAQMCTREYRPVCATRDTGIHCVTTPCPSTEQVTKSNACSACADAKVHSYVKNACVN